MAIVANEVRYVVTLDGSKDVSLLPYSNKFWYRGFPRAPAAISPLPLQRPAAAAGPVSSGGGNDAPFRATCPRPPRSPEAEKANAEMSAAITRGESEAVARLIAEGDVQMDHKNEQEEGWLHLAARAHRGDHAICTSQMRLLWLRMRYSRVRAPPPLLFQFSLSSRSATSTPVTWRERTPWGPPSLTSAIPK